MFTVENWLMLRRRSETFFWASLAIRLPMVVQAGNDQLEDFGRDLGGSIVGLWHVVYTANGSTFNETLDQCEPQARPDNTPCTDGNVCTQTNTCQGGFCTGTNPVVCTALDQCHNAGTCNPLSGCSNPAKPNGSDEIDVRYINFEDQTGASNIPRSIVYFFHANGQFVSSPLAVREKLANLLEKKGYYAKIECMTTVESSQESARVMTDFLTGALPEIFKCMPDWNKENAGGAAASPAVAQK